MKKNIDEIIKNSVKKTFCDMAFIDTAAFDGKKDIVFSHILSIDILKPFFGKIALFLPFECKNKIAENIYGKNFKELKSQEIDDCQLELLNILVGNILSGYFGSKKKCKVDLPSIIFDKDEIEWNKKNIDEYYFDAEGSVFKLVFQSSGLHFSRQSGDKK